MATANGQLKTYDEAKHTCHQHTSPCSDCPFARKSLPGWLGMMSPEEWIDVARGEGIIECHTTDKLCAGGAIFRANICKLLRDPDAFRLPPDRVKVFSWPIEFLAHHGKRMGD